MITKLRLVFVTLFLLSTTYLPASASDMTHHLSKVQAIQLMGLCEIIADEEHAVIAVLRVGDCDLNETGNLSVVTAYHIRLDNRPRYIFWLNDNVVGLTASADDRPTFLSAVEVDALVTAMRAARITSSSPPSCNPEAKRIGRYANATDPIKWLEEQLSELVGLTQLCLRERGGRWVILTGTRTGYKIRFADAKYQFDHAWRAVARVEGTDCVILRHIHGQEFAAFCERLDDLFANQPSGILEVGRGRRPLTDQEMKEVRAP